LRMSRISSRRSSCLGGAAAASAAFSLSKRYCITLMILTTAKTQKATIRKLMVMVMKFP
jgi:hypothetical protein